jgi:hypothetical protein
MGCGTSTSKRDVGIVTTPRSYSAVPQDGRTWQNTGKMDPGLAVSAQENSEPYGVLSFPPRAPELSPAYEGDSYGTGVVYDCTRVCGTRSLSLAARARECFDRSRARQGAATERERARVALCKGSGQAALALFSEATRGAAGCGMGTGEPSARARAPWIEARHAVQASGSGRC